MHASLAAIGRACKVEDEDPPASGSFVDVSSAECPTRPYHRRIYTVTELISTANELLRDNTLLPLVNKLFWNGEQSNAGTEAVENLSEYSDLGPPVSARLDQLTGLHRLYTLAEHSRSLDRIAGLYNALATGPVSLMRNVEEIVLREYDVLSMYTYPRSTTTTLSKQPVQPTSYACMQNLPNNLLGELRVVCECERQWLTQLQHIYYDQQACTPLDRLNSPVVCNLIPQLTIKLKQYAQNRHLTYRSLVAAHHLIYSGLSHLAHSDLTRFTHGELWEMMRGMEELDILTRQLQKSHGPHYSNGLQHFITHQLIDRSHDPYLNSELISNPFFTVPSVSLGYLFLLITRQRSLKLAHAIYQQLNDIFSEDDSSNRTVVLPFATQGTKPSLVEAFRSYLNTNYDRTASEYLRTEYEFISGFLDILSQSTNLVYQVQRLKFVYGTAPTTTEFAHHPHSSDPSDPHPAPNSLPSLRPANTRSPKRALSVEGIHGILIHKDTNTVQKSSPVRDPVRNADSFVVRQDLLSRAGTFDRYVAIGSTVITNEQNLSDGDSKIVYETQLNQKQNTNDRTSSANPSPASPNARSKKAVHWSDHREVSVRHQVIGRYLEMIWRHTEVTLTNLFSSPPASITSELVAGTKVDKKPNQLPILNNRLMMGPLELRKVSSNLREVAKVDFFPTGFIPALKRQALRLDEMAHRRCHYMSVAISKCKPSNTTAIVDAVSVNNDETNPLPRLDQISTLDPANHLISDCVLVSLSRSRESSSSNTEISSFYDCPPDCHSPQLCTEVISLFKLLCNCLEQLAGKEVDGYQNMISTIVNQLHASGVHCGKVDLWSLVQQSPLQLNGVVRFCYECSRRISAIHTRLTYLLNTHLTGHVEEFNFVNHHSYSSNSSPPSYNRLSELTDNAIETLAGLYRLNDLIRCIRQLSDRLIRSAQLRLIDMEHAFQSSGNESTNSVCSPLPLNRLRSIVNLPTGIQLARFIASLVSMNHTWDGFGDLLQCSILEIIRQFSAHCRQVAKTLWAEPLGQLTSQPIPTSELDKTVQLLLNHPPRCQLCPKNIPDSANRVCPFHRLIYTHVSANLFTSFCNVWLQHIQTQTDDVCNELLQNHTSSIRELFGMLFTHQSNMPISLLVTLCELPVIQRLQEQSNVSYSDLYAAPVTQSQTAESDSRSNPSLVESQNMKVDYVSSLTTATASGLSTVSKKPDRASMSIRQRLNTPTETLLNIASGLRNNLIPSFNTRNNNRDANCAADQSRSNFISALTSIRSRSASRSRNIADTASDYTPM